MSSNHTSNLSPPSFNGENYQVWTIKMKAHLKGLGLWKWVETEREIQPLGNNPTLNQISIHEEESTKAPRALSIIRAAVSKSVFTRIMTCESGKDAWDKVKEIYEGNKRTKRMQVLNLKREFETLNIKERDTIGEYYDKLMEVVNKIQLMGEDLPDSRVVENVFVSFPEKFEEKLSSLEDSRNINELELSELIKALQAQEQRRNMKDEENKRVVEGALVAKNLKGKMKLSQCYHCNRYGHEEKDCWHKGKPQCFQCMKFGHVQKNYRNKIEESVRGKNANLTQVVDEDELF